MSKNQATQAIKVAITLAAEHYPPLPDGAPYEDRRRNNVNRANSFIAALSGALKESDATLATSVFALLREPT